MLELKTALIFNDDFEICKNDSCDKCMGRDKTCLFVASGSHGTTICKDCLLQVIQEMDRVITPSIPSSNSVG